MKGTKSITIILLYITLCSCWDSYVNTKQTPEKKAPREVVPSKKDSNLLRRPEPNQHKLRKNKALDTLKPIVASAFFRP
ncbi:hypothetical protein PP182_01795 [Maribacter sp. PR1]|uniref:Uncharacterized protein n=1 Tax=Maribacter cobaltidurans TaxID=1178778 RepID=A0ABU7IP90_9FLAO|nr:MULTISPECIES: hypothetical protein [Maribacter]MDC6387397.1 hypothetical protein [Maribacter sp. PR1]MEE1974782.1 hypothetical protein [Maribacter cobaltidurans]